VTGAVHGYAHVSHAPPGSKPCELGIDRPAETVLAELRRGREILARMFGGRLSALVVPPWNRIHPEIARRVGEAGFSGVSAHGWDDGPAGVVAVNVHVDLVHWSGGRTGRPLAWLDARIAENLATARLRNFPGIGILAHHRVHDAAAWAGLASILARFATPEVEWTKADSLIPAAAQA
jgi:hypothetical protein